MSSQEDQKITRIGAVVGEESNVCIYILIEMRYIHTLPHKQPRFVNQRRFKWDAIGKKGVLQSFTCLRNARLMGRPLSPVSWDELKNDVVRNKHLDHYYNCALIRLKHT